MAKNKKVVAPISMPTEPVTVFEVSEDGGTLRLADHTEPETRAEFYEDIADQWDASPQDLLDAAEACEPLAWAVNSLYQDFRDELIAKIEAAQSAEKPNNKRLTALQAKLEELPEEPEEGATDWLLGLSASEFNKNVVPNIEDWFSEPPDWNFEDDYLPQSSTAQGAALIFFGEMDPEEIGLLGVDIVEGEHPGSSYYAAELRGDIDQANRAAVAAGIPVWFKAEEL
jgi:hypothetical protein